VIDMDLLSVIRRWHFRQGMAIREIKRRTGLSRNTIRKYLRADAVEAVFKLPDRPSSRTCWEANVPNHAFAIRHQRVVA
jgi:transposase